MIETNADTSFINYHLTSLKCSELHKNLKFFFRYRQGIKPHIDRLVDLVTDSVAGVDHNQTLYGTRELEFCTDHADRICAKASLNHSLHMLFLDHDIIFYL